MHRRTIRGNTDIMDDRHLALAAIAAAVTAVVLGAVAGALAVTGFAHAWLLMAASAGVAIMGVGWWSTLRRHDAAVRKEAERGIAAIEEFLASVATRTPSPAPVVRRCPRCGEPFDPVTLRCACR